MNSFRLNVDNSEVYKITLENLEKYTYRQKPWLQQYEGVESWFAVCPGCNNPVQIVGLLSKKLNSYGKHFIPKTDFKHKINGVVNIDEMHCCIYYSGQTGGDVGKRPPDDPYARLTYDIVVNNFDRVIYYLNKVIGIKISQALAEEMLLSYISASGWQSYKATLENIPFVMANCQPARGLIGRVIINSELKTSLIEAFKSNGLDVSFSENNQIINTSSPQKFINIQFVVINHNRKVINNNLQETVELCIFYQHGKTRIDLHRQIIKFDYDFFRNLLHNSHDKYRNHELLKIAKNLMK